jgi:ABC-type transport system involved in Fe-S cluster assembly fused permease/ATPase subunit
MRTVSSAGKIVVLKDGVVAEQGSLAQLLHTMKPPSLKICI